MYKINSPIKFLLYFIIGSSLISFGCCQSVTYPQPPSSHRAGQDSSGTIQSGSSYVQTYTDGQIPIAISKYTKDLRTEYNKGENITIMVRIINCNRNNHIDKAYLREEIPHGFRFMPSKNHGCQNYTTSDGINMTAWCFKGSEISDIKHLEYTLNSTKSGIHNLIGTILTADVIDYLGAPHEVATTSNDLIIKIINKPPKYIGLVEDESPIFARRQSDKYVCAEFEDQDHDKINCSLIVNNVTDVKAGKRIQLDNGRTRFIWNLKGHTNEDGTFKLKATDNESEIEVGTFELRTYFLTKYERYIYSQDIANLLSFILRNSVNIFVLLLPVFGALYMSRGRRWIKKYTDPLEYKADQQMERVHKANEWNENGLKLYQLRKYEEAISAYDKAIEIDDSFANAYNNKGVALAAISRYDDAIKCFDSAINIERKFVDAWINKGNAFKAIGDTVQADASFRQAEEYK